MCHFSEEGNHPLKNHWFRKSKMSPRDGSAATSTCCSCRESECCFQVPHGNSTYRASSSFLWHQQVAGTYVLYAGKTYSVAVHPFEDCLYPQGRHRYVCAWCGACFTGFASYVVWSFVLKVLGVFKSLQAQSISADAAPPSKAALAVGRLES